jgi:hypothetical protein
LAYHFCRLVRKTGVSVPPLRTAAPHSRMYGAEPQLTIGVKLTGQTAASAIQHSSRIGSRLKYPIPRAFLVSCVFSLLVLSGKNIDRLMRNWECQIRRVWKQKYYTVISARSQAIFQKRSHLTFACVSIILLAARRLPYALICACGSRSVTCTFLWRL